MGIMTPNLNNVVDTHLLVYNNKSRK